MFTLHQFDRAPRLGYETNRSWRTTIDSIGNDPAGSPAAVHYDVRVRRTVEGLLVCSLERNGLRIWPSERTPFHVGVVPLPSEAFEGADL